MKKFILFHCVCFLLASISYAQISSGSVYFGGSIGGSSVKQESSISSTEGKRSSINISPSVGLAVKDNLIAGINFIYSNDQSKSYLNWQDHKNNTYGGGIFLRKYFPIIKRLYFFGEGGLDYTQYKYETPAGTGSYYAKRTTKTVSAGIFPGLAFNIYKSFYIETAFPILLELGYNQTNDLTTNFGSTTTTKDKGIFLQSYLSNSSYLNFGVRFIIPKK